MSNLPPGDLKLATRLGHRIEEFVTPDGQKTQSRNAGIWASDEAIKSLWNLPEVQQDGTLRPTFVPWQFAVATAAHEGAINEVDTELNGIVTYGCFRIMDEERAKVGLPEANLLNLIDSVRVEKRLAEWHYNYIVSNCHLQEPVSPDIWAFVGAAHNMGYAGSNVINRIKTHGLNYASYAKDNPTMDFARKGYGADILTGKGRDGGAIPVASPSKPERLLLARIPGKSQNKAQGVAGAVFLGLLGIATMRRVLR